MRVKLPNNKEYKVSWRYSTEEETDSKQYETDCYIEEVVDTDGILLAYTTTYKSHKDKLDKNKARKVSLGFALDVLCSNSPDLTQYRKNFWDAYKEMRNGKW